MMRRANSRIVHFPCTCAFLSLLLIATVRDASSQIHSLLCSNGFGHFETKFFTGVTVRVSAIRNGQLASRTCSATLSWGTEELSVVSEAAQVDIDVLGADLGFKAPVMAIQSKKSDADSFMTYQIYSLQKPPKLLRTISGGDYFSAADTDLDGRIEIWTGEAAAIDGFEGLTLGELDFAPTVALRFEDRRLVDVSSQFRRHYDDQIAGVRAQLTPSELKRFKDSDGKLLPAPGLSVEQLHRLRLTKIKVLEIVWSYLYSAREQDAWHELAEMWPAADFERIHGLLANVQARGLRSQIDVSMPKTGFHLKRPAYIFDAITVDDAHSVEAEVADFKADLKVDTPPQAILLRWQTLASDQLEVPKTGEEAELVVDAAGKVHSAKLVDGGDPMLIQDSAGWKFIPAFKNGHAVASRMRMVLGLAR
jgi:hypothetical protein